MQTQPYRINRAQNSTYNGKLIGSRIRSIKWHHFELL